MAHRDLLDRVDMIFSAAVNKMTASYLGLSLQNADMAVIRSYGVCITA